MRAIDADRLLDRCKFYHLPNGDIAVPIIDVQHAPTIEIEPNWIPVTERLPEIRHDVLFAVFFHETWRTMQGYRQDGEFMFWCNGRLESALDNEHRVSAWMPIPEPWKGEVTT